jgi:thioesterase domain-containing protein
MAADAAARRDQSRTSETQLTGQPILQRMSKDDGSTRFSTTLSNANWIMDDHRLKDGTAILPGAAWPEISAEALRALSGDDRPRFTLSGLTVFRPVRLEGDAPNDMRVTLRPEKDGIWRLEARTREAAGWALAVEAEIGPPESAVPGPLDLAAIAARCPDRHQARDGGVLPSKQEDRVAFGPRWQVLRQTATGNGEGLATLTLPAHAASDTAEAMLHPALYDIGTGWGLALLPDAPPGEIWVPVTSGTVQVFAPLPAEIRSWVRLTESPGSASAVFDVTLTDSVGQVLVEVKQLTFRSLAAAELLARPASPTPGEVIPDEGAGRALSTAEARLRQALDEGIRPAEGAEAFMRALATGTSQVLVSSLDLPALVRQADVQDRGPMDEGPGFARPALETAFIAPRTEVERILAGFWSGLLGVGEVGVEDDFFALGGHSLIAVRLFAKIRKQWNVDFPISILFDAPTISRVAALITDRIGPEEEKSADPAAKANPAGPNFTHLVAMHGNGAVGTKTPFFLVAGMFGNVLNLRHLAHLLGRDRPFYGLQARGLFGEAAPHETLEAAAADCIAELRQIQPRGPYLLGGFSGGGLTAWEIGRQLRAAGETVALIVLLDTPMPVPPPLSRADRALIKLSELREGGPRFLVQWLRRRMEWERARRLRGAGEPDPRVPSFQNAAIEAAFRGAVGVYRLERWEGGRVVLYRPPLDRRWKVTGGSWINSEKEHVFADNQWTSFAPGLEVVEVPGNHDSMVLEPNVRVLATRMRQALAKAEAEVEGNHLAAAVPKKIAAE